MVKSNLSSVTMDMKSLLSKKSSHDSKTVTLKQKANTSFLVKKTIRDKVYKISKTKKRLDKSTFESKQEGPELPITVSSYYNSVQLPHRETLLIIRKRILDIVPQAIEVMSYGMPAFQIENGIKVAGILANKKHIGYYPFSGNILELFSKEISNFKQTKSALHIPIDKPIESSLINILIQARIKEGLDMAAAAAVQRKNSTR